MLSGLLGTEAKIKRYWDLFTVPFSVVLTASVFPHQWELGKLGDHGWFIRSLYSGNNHYLTIENGLGNGTSIVANGFPATWEIKAEPREGEDVV